MTGQNGGAAFIILYFACIFLLGIPGMVSEFIIGRRAQSNAYRAYGKMGGRWWRFVGILGILTSTIILGFYAVVAGWCLQYLFSSIAGYINGDAAYVQDEIAQLAQKAHSRDAILKVILETCYLNDEQKKLACRLSEAAGADFVKTSTGYGSGGATVADVKLMRAAVSDKVRVKASGGIRTLDMVLACRNAGATRCGVSATVKIMEEAKKRLEEGTLTDQPLSPVENAGNGAY